MQTSEQTGQIELILANLSTRQFEASDEILVKVSIFISPIPYQIWHLFELFKKL